MRMKKRFLGILLSLVMALGLMPGMSLTAYADGDVASVTVGETATKYATIADAVSAWNSAADSATLTLLADVETSSTITVSGTKTLDLNGHGIKATVSDSVIKVLNGANLTLTDSNPGNVSHKYSPCPSDRFSEWSDRPSKPHLIHGS